MLLYLCPFPASELSLLLGKEKVVLEKGFCHLGFPLGDLPAK